MHAAAYEPQTWTHPPGAHLEAIFREHSGAVYRAAYRITGNGMDAEDVLQTVFARLLNRAEPLDLSDGAAGYLHRAAINAALDLMRARKRAQAVGLEDAEDLAEDAAQGPDRRSHSRQLASHLRGALARLSPRQAEVFTLRYLEGLSNLEISRSLGSSQTAIAVILHRARHRLQKELGSLQGELS